MASKPNNNTKIRPLKEFCGGCNLFLSLSHKCKKPMLNIGWKDCPCRNCLIKSVCSDLCEEMQDHRKKIVSILKAELHLLADKLENSKKEIIK